MKRNVRDGQRLSLLLVLSLALTLGCTRSSLQGPADPEKARAALQDALESWQRGESVEAMRQRKPQVVVIDPDWERGQRLVSFKVAEDKEFRGLNLRCRVDLTLEDGKGQRREKKVAYGVHTQPLPNITREESTPTD